MEDEEGTAQKTAHVSAKSQETYQIQAAESLTCNLLKTRAVFSCGSDELYEYVKRKVPRH